LVQKRSLLILADLFKIGLVLLSRLFVFFWTACFASNAFALSAHEILLLVNEDSAASVEVANHYIDLRGVPLENVVYLSLPDQARRGRDIISRDQFRTYIYEPVERIIKDRNLDHVLAWVYSVEFPVRVQNTSERVLSLMGATLLGGEPFDVERVKQGAWRSPFYAGPNPPDSKNISKAKEFFSFRNSFNGYRWPSFMLGYSDARGNTIREVLDSLERSVKADFLHPAGTVYFVSTEDVRSKCRAWQFETAKNILESQNIRAEIVEAFPANKRAILGVMAGSAMVNVKQMGRLVPGAYADHLTSYGAAFQIGQQTKITEWIRNGAASSSGTVEEPMAIWRKFPTAFMFAHYTAGATVMESLYQSVSCPLELLMLGDPLTSPWRQAAGIMVMPFEDVVTGEAARFALDYRGLDANNTRVDLFLDGKWMGKGNGPWVQLPTANLPDGYHVVRVVAKSADALPVRASDEAGFTLNRQGRAIKIREGMAKEWPANERRTFEFEVEGHPEMALIRRGETIIGVSPPDGTLTVACSPSKLGKGPVMIQPEAVYEDGQRVKGPPVHFFVTDGKK
jgi:uncharacterized protein (TIGR03790 family)